MSHNTRAQFVYLTYHHGNTCKSKPFGYSIKPFRLNECINENGEHYKISCYLGPGKSSLFKSSYADAFCQTKTGTSTVFHGDTCATHEGPASVTGSMPAGASRMLGAPLAYSLLHCEAALPTSLAARDQLLVQSFPHRAAASAASAAAAASSPAASPTAPPTPVYSYGGLTSSSPDTLATLLGQCVEVTRLGRVVNHRMVSYVSGDGLGSNLIVREVRYTAQDLCSGKIPVVSDSQVVYLA
jgi:hypothetical protein